MHILICDHKYKNKPTELQKSFEYVIKALESDSQFLLYENICGSEESRKTLREYISNEKIPIDLVVIHYGANDLLFHKNTHPSGLTVLYVSSEGRSNEHESLGDGRYNLFLRPSFCDFIESEDGGKPREDWVKVLAPILLGQSEEICQRIYAGVARKYFIQEKPLEVFPALCILCQGFLGVWREVGIDAEKLVVGKIEEALKLMRWDDLPQEIRNSVRERLNGDCPNDQQEIVFSDLYKPSWWQVFEDNRYDFLTSLIESEFSACENNDEASRDSVLKLVKFISGETDISNDKMPEIVASAYIAIYRVLEQS